MSADRPVTLAAIIGAHGIAGEVRLKVFADDLASYKSFNDGALTLKSARPGSNGVIARFAEIADRNAAEALRGTQLTVPRSALPPLEDGEYYHVDLLGLPAVSDAGEALGKVIAIDNYGAGDVLEIERPGIDGKPGKRFMVPMQPHAVPEWDAERLVIDAGFAE
jgi:16S rRNA processing protein RimM